MAAEFRDLNNDGMPDIWLTAVELETFPLFRNLGKGGFTDITIRSRLARQTMQMSGWSNGVADFESDGWKDLFLARSNVLDNIADFSTMPCFIRGIKMPSRNCSQLSLESWIAMTVQPLVDGPAAWKIWPFGRLLLVT